VGNLEADVQGSGKERHEVELVHGEDAKRGAHWHRAEQYASTGVGNDEDWSSRQAVDDDAGEQPDHEPG
jgi:hypothetical protein